MSSGCTLVVTLAVLLRLINCPFIVIFLPLVDMFYRGSLKIKIIRNWLQIISLCSQVLARCHVTRPHCSVAPAPKLSGTEKLLPCHRLKLRRSFFPDWQSWQADVFVGPKVSTAMGAKRYSLPMLAYFSSLREAAISAAAPYYYY